MSAQHTPKLPHMWIDTANPGVIRFGDPDDMAGMLAGVIAPDVARACNAHDDLVAALKTILLNVSDTNVTIQTARAALAKAGAA